MSTARRSLVVVLIFILIAGAAAGLIYLVTRASSTTVVIKPTAAPPIQKPGLYSANFDQNEPGNEWSATPIGATPTQRKFLGPFREVPLIFTMDGLPEHRMIHLTFELITYQPWNGDSQNFGRDLWDMRVVGGQPLIHTTFSDCGFFDDNNEQSFPDQYPWYPTHPGFTGATTQQSLGYKHSWGGNGPFGIDSTYLFDLTFPHTASTLKLQFKSQIKHHENKPYGFLNFKVETLDHPATASDAQLAAWWQDLGDEDPVKAYHAIWSLIATADQATTYIQHHLPPRDPAIPINIDQAAQFERSFEYDTPQARQFARAIHVLEVINSPQSKQLLADIGYTGTPQGGPPTRWDLPRPRHTGTTYPSTTPATTAASNLRKIGDAIKNSN